MESSASFLPLQGALLTLLLNNSHFSPDDCARVERKVCSARSRKFQKSKTTMQTMQKMTASFQCVSSGSLITIGGIAGGDTLLSNEPALPR